MSAAAARTVRVILVGTMVAGVILVGTMVAGVTQLAGIVQAAGVAVPAGVAQAAVSNPSPVVSNPTKAEIQAAIKRAESAKTLWATVNICSSRRYPNTLGVRGQIPALGFASWMSLSIQVDFFSTPKQRFEPSPHATKLIHLGRTATRLEQGGQTFSFPPHSGLLNATIDFRWRRSGKLLGHTARRTTAGHPTADFGSPPHYSAKQCLIR